MANPDRHTRKLALTQIRQALLVALPLMLIVNLIIWGGYRVQKEYLRQQWKIQAEAILDGTVISIERLRNDLYADLRLLAGNPYLERVLDQTNESNLLALAGEWEVFSAVKRRYEQIRWIDETGMERLRVDLTSNGVRRIDDAQLQDKSQRYYFREAMSLGEGKIYASPIDLNIEHGEIDRPFRPMLRLAMPVQDRSGKQRGLLVMNVRAEAILEDLARHTLISQGRLLLLDFAGYYLRGFEADQAWGRMREEGDSAYYRFDKRYPLVWKEMVRKGAGLEESPSGLFAYRTIRYGTGGLEYHYFLVLALLPRELSAQLAAQRATWLAVSLLISAVLLSMALYVARCRWSGGGGGFLARVSH